MESFSGFKKEVKNYICKELKDKLKFRCAVYRGHEFKIAIIKILLDDNDLLEINDILWGRLYNKGLIDYFKEPETLQKNLIEQGHYNTRQFYKFVKEFYYNMDIKTALNSENPLIEFFAIIDKRCGKRTLEKLNKRIDNKPDFIKNIYNLRMQGKN